VAGVRRGGEQSSPWTWVYEAALTFVGGAVGFSGRLEFEHLLLCSMEPLLEQRLHRARR
jgi:hypothetical protein